MEIIEGRATGAPSEARNDSFTGTVWVDPVLLVPGELSINTVFFSPSARTFWHTHERGQILNVVAGRGLVCTEGGKPQPIRVGDTVWIPAGERHWHGATPDSYMIHTPTSLGRTDWQGLVADRDYTP